MYARKLLNLKHQKVFTLPSTVEGGSMAAIMHHQSIRAPFTTSFTTPVHNRRFSRIRVRASQQQPSECQQGPSDSTSAPEVSRRQLISLAGLCTAAVGLIGSAKPAVAYIVAPDGYRSHLDRLDGYSFFYPEQWTAVTSSGNDIFLRNPFNVDQNLFVDISSPSSSRYSSVTDLGTPDDAAARILDQYLNKEFMSTRLGIRRTGEIVSASSREGPEGREYYDIQIRMASYASRNPYLATQGEVMKDYGLEWDRRFITTLGVANKRLYELRLQTSSITYEQDKPEIDLITKSFKVVEVEV